MVPVVDYPFILQELKKRFILVDSQDERVQFVGLQMCRRMAGFWGSDQPQSIETTIDRLEKQWAQEGLL